MLQRILLQDKEGNLSRICSFGFGLDKKNEEYIKFSFPDLKGTPLFFNDVESNNPEEKLIDEYSFHIKSGVSHFKSSNQKRFYRQENQINPNSEEFKTIYLFAYIIYDLNHFKIFNKKQDKYDYLLPNKFNPEKGKVLEFHLTRIQDKVVIPNIIYNDLKRKAYHPFIKGKYRLLIIEYEFININKEKTGVTIHRKYDINEEYIESEI